MTHRRLMEGSLHPDFAGVAGVLRGLIESYGGGGAVCVYHRGECVVDIWGGVRNRAGDPWQAATMAPSFSTTKGVAATLLHIFVDRGALDYDDRVADHWPEFGCAGKENITVRQVLSHQSGLYHIRQMIDRADRMRDWEHMIHAIEVAQPIHPPGERTGYHGLTFGYLVGEIVQRVSGRRFSDLVRDEIATPLGLDGMYIGAPEEAVERAAELIWPKRGILGLKTPIPPVFGETVIRAGGALHWVLRNLAVEFDLGSIIEALAPRGISAFDFGSPETLRASIPAANGLFTARSLARLYAALAAGGEIDGVRLLSQRTLARATRLQGGASRRAVIPFDMRWRLGYHGVATSRGFPKRAFGHFGLGGSGAWADPKRDLAVALIVNSGIGTPFGDLRIVRVGGAALAGALQRGNSADARRHDQGARRRAVKRRARTPAGAPAKQRPPSLVTLAAVRRKAGAARKRERAIPPNT